MAMNVLRLALIGYGKMGKLVEEVARTRGHCIATLVNTKQPLSPALLKEVDVCIDFSHPDLLLQHLPVLVQSGKALVIGTTGWSAHFDEVKKIVEAHHIGVVYGANFSIGIHLFKALLAEAARLIGPYPDYDVIGWELHHRQKIDAPSGTALNLMRVLQEVLKKDIPFNSIRGGHFPGTHSVLFDSPYDTIELRHTTRSRKGFAEGAVAAAEWIQHRVGFFSIEAMLSL